MVIKKRRNRVEKRKKKKKRTKIKEHAQLLLPHLCVSFVVVFLLRNKENTFEDEHKTGIYLFSVACFALLITFYCYICGFPFVFL